MDFKVLVVILLTALSDVCCSNEVDVSWGKPLTLTPGESKSISVSLSEQLNETSFLFLNTTYKHSLSGAEPVDYPKLVALAEKLEHVKFNVEGKVVGQSVIHVDTNNTNITLPTPPDLRVFVVHSHGLYIANMVIGWMYFAAWSISFYPQTILNFQRKSVVGLNFDFLAYNLLGFTCYGLYNIGMYWIPSVKEEYQHEHPDGVNPVQINDVCFTLHAVLITTVTIVQCFLYERGGQKVSLVAKVLVSLSLVSLLVLLVVAACSAITWLTYLMVFSYLKLGISLIKYIPQAYMNYRRKSTEGWSIGNVLLDFTGGSLSILQMILQSYNNDEWDLVFGDPTKFGLGLISVLFDVFFMLQHYVFYKEQVGYHDAGLLLGDESEA